MQRRAFLHSGLAAGVLSLTARGATAEPRRGLAPRRIRPDGTVRLSSNENPLGISPAGRAAIIDGLVDANRYPRGDDDLRVALAAKHGVEPEQIVLGAGSTEVLKMAVDAFAMPDGHLITAEPTYEDAPWYSQAGPAHLVMVPLSSEKAHDLDAMRQEVRRAGGRALVYICNPNNPTGTVTPSAAVDAWIAEADPTVTFLVDEAYFEFVESDTYHSALKWVSDRPNVIVARTFSKVYGMAGVRLGYGVTHPDTAQRMNRLRVRNNANHLAIVAGLASLKERGFVRQSLEVNRRSRQIAYACLKDLDLAYFPTHTNFLMHRIHGDLQSYVQRMSAAGLRVGRPFPPMLDYNRVSLGLPNEMERWASTLRDFRKRGWV